MEKVYADFYLLFCLCHQSRVEIRGTGSDDDRQNPEDCWLEDWANQADQQGTRAREKLRDGVEAAIKALGAGFLTSKHQSRSAIRQKLATEELSTQDYYRQLLRLVYRLLLLLVAEEKRDESGDNLLHPPGTSPEVRERYARYYGVGRVRSLAYERRGTAHTDLYESLKVLFDKLRTGYEPLGIPGMGSFLFSEGLHTGSRRSGHLEPRLAGCFSSALLHQRTRRAAVAAFDGRSTSAISAVRNWVAFTNPCSNYIH